MANINTAKGEFHIQFKVAPNTSFDVAYNRCGCNKEPYFTTSAEVRTRNNVGCIRGGQCQEDALNGNDLFYGFFKKWDPKHLKKLSKAELNELKCDLKKLKDSGAPFIEAENGDNELFPAYREQELFIMKPHKAYRIKWDTDGATYKECGLPTSVIVPFYMDENEVSDWLSDTFGFCHDGFCTNF